MNAEGKVMGIFVVFAIATGVICAGVGLKGLQGLALAIIFFYVSYKVTPQIINLEETEFEVGAMSMLKTGGLPFFFVWLMVWTLIYTLTV